MVGVKSKNKITLSHTFTHRASYRQSVSLFLGIAIYAIKLYLEGVGFRAIERLTGVSHNSVIRWVKDLAGEIERLRPEMEERVHAVEIDEMWHFIQKKRTNAGSGWLGLESEKPAVALS